MTEALTLDAFMSALRELPEFQGATDEALRSLYATDYLPRMQAQAPQAPSGPSLDPTQADAAGSFPIKTMGVGATPVDLRFRPPQPQVSPYGAPAGAAITASAPLWAGKDSAFGVHAERELNGKKMGIIFRYLKQF